MMHVMKHVPWKELGWAVAFVVLLAVIYCGSYLGMVERDGAIKNGRAVSIGPYYRLGHQSLKPVFALAHSIDCLARPTYWSLDGYSRDLAGR